MLTDNNGQVHLNFDNDVSTECSDSDVSGTVKATYVPLQPTSYEVWQSKYCLKDEHGTPVDSSVSAMYRRVAKGVASVEKTDKKHWEEQFMWALENGATPAGRILSNTNAGKYKPSTSLINCTVSETVEDRMDGILTSVKNAGMTLKAGCGIGYEFSTLRPKGAYVNGAGASTSGPLSFMDIFNAACFTVSSAGGRRGAQMATFAIWHPDVEDFIQAKRENGRFRQFNMSLLLDDDFVDAVKRDLTYDLVFPVKQSEIDKGLVKKEDLVVKTMFWTPEYCVSQEYVLVDDTHLLCKRYKTVNAKDIWNTVMKSTYDFAEPGVLFISRINELNNNYFCESIRATNPCVTGDTVILTDAGYKRIDTLVDTEVAVWNGFEWSTVVPTVTGTNQEIIDLEFSDGSKLSCTPYHKFILNDNTRVEAKDLSVGSELALFNLPVIKGADFEVRLKRCENLIYSSTLLEYGLLFHETYESLCDIKALFHTLGIHTNYIRGEADTKDAIFVSFIDFEVLRPYGITLEAYEGSSKKCHRKPITVTSMFMRSVREPKVYCFTEEKNHSGIFNGIMTAQCGEQPLPPNGACLLGSINVAKFVKAPFTENADFDWDTYKRVVKIFTRFLDNVVELNNLPLEEQRHEIAYKRRHGMGFLGLGSALSMLGETYGSKKSIEFTSKLMEVMAIEGFEEGIHLAIEKGPAPIFNDEYSEGISNKVMWCNGKYMERIWKKRPDLLKLALKHGCRFTHHTSLAPTGTISLSVNNNASNGIEPTFAHKYTRNVIIPGKKSKKAVNVYSYEMLLYKELTGKDEVPDFFSTTDSITIQQHVDIQAAAQYWCDSSISKTINVPTDIPFEDFKQVYLYAFDKGLKGCTTFRFNPEAFQGVLVKGEDLQATEYIFTLADGSEVRTKGDDIIEYDGEEHTAANLYDAIKEGYYGKF